MNGPVIWIDTDTGVDDAVALLTALGLERQGKLTVAGVSTVCGNVEQEKTFRNARDVLYLAGREDIPVYPGASGPLMKKLETAAYIHGENGLGGASLPASPAKEETKKAWDAIYECAAKMEGELELVLLGPETNAAAALALHPDLAGMLKRILVMGGAEVGGNRTAAAEFNIFVDPHAAQAVFSSGVPVVMCGLDVTMKALLDAHDIAAITGSGSRSGKLFAQSTGKALEIYKKNGLDGYCVHDACPVFYSVYPDMFRAEEAGVYVETRGRITEGKTVVDRDTDVKFGEKNAVVVLDLDRAWFAREITGILSEI